MTYVNAEVVLLAVGGVLQDHSLRAGTPWHVIPRRSDRLGADANLAGPHGPLCEITIDGHREDPDRSQTQVPLGYVYENRDSGDRTVEEYDPNSPLPPPSERIRVGEIKSYIYELEVALQITVPLMATEPKPDGTSHTYTHPVPVDYGSGDGVYGIGGYDETVQREFPYRSTRVYERVITDALRRIDPLDGNRQTDLVDPRPTGDPDRIAGDWPPLLAVDPGEGRDRPEPSSGTGTEALRVWEQRIDLEYYRLVDTTDRDGPDEPITDIQFPTLDGYWGDEDDLWPGEIVQTTPNITPEDLNEDRSNQS